MEKTISKGDIIVVEKLSYGPNFIKNYFQVPTGNLFLKTGKDRMTEFKRPRGVSNLSRNDIVVFTIKIKGRTYVKRIIGLPGEIIELVDSRVFINHEPQKELDNLTFQYVHKNKLKSNKKMLISNMERNNIDLARNMERVIFPVNSVVEDIFPKEKILNWNRDNYGEIWIPKKGESIVIDRSNKIFYIKLMELESGLKLNYNVDEQAYYLGENKIEKYTFLYNYYFMLGDNRHFSRDSRSFGFIREENIKGKLIFKI